MKPYAADFAGQVILRAPNLACVFLCCFFVPFDYLISVADANNNAAKSSFMGLSFRSDVGIAFFSAIGMHYLSVWVRWCWLRPFGFAIIWTRVLLENGIATIYEPAHFLALFASALWVSHTKVAFLSSLDVERPMSLFRFAHKMQDRVVCLQYLDSLVEAQRTRYFKVELWDKNIHRTQAWKLYVMLTKYCAAKQGLQLSHETCYVNSIQLDEQRLLRHARQSEKDIHNLLQSYSNYENFDKIEGHIQKAFYDEALLANPWLPFRRSSVGPSTVNITIPYRHKSPVFYGFSGHILFSCIFILRVLICYFFVHVCLEYGIHEKIINYLRSEDFSSLVCLLHKNLSAIFLEEDPLNK